MGLSLRSIAFQFLVRQVSFRERGADAAVSGRTAVRALCWRRHFGAAQSMARQLHYFRRTGISGGAVSMPPDSADVPEARS